MAKARRAIKIRVNKENNKTDDEKLQKIKKLISPNITYNKIKYKNEFFSLGDCLLIRDENEGSYLIGKLIKIIQYNGYKKYPYWPTIQVKWYYKKSDINREKNGLIDDRLYNSISDYEVFSSDHTDIIFIESIVSTCKIFTYEEYETLAEHTFSTFFSRASYDPIKQLFNPPYDKWEKSCICYTPLNPDQLYIKCDMCEKWFHPKCCSIDDEKLSNLTEFYCKLCDKKS